jgi:hypothetical protein
MAKIWTEVFELMFGKDHKYIKWGESVSSTSTNIKKANNDNKKHTIGCKVDGRILCKINSLNEAFDICQIEAAKSTTDSAKVFTDRTKLAIESKCIVDDIVSKPSFITTNSSYGIQNVQIAGIQADTSTLKLIDNGLYVHIPDFDISLKPNVLQFASILSTWVRKLISFKNECYLTDVVISSASSSTPLQFNAALGRAENENAELERCNASWVRGTFFFPGKDGQPVFPKNFLHERRSASSFTNDRYFKSSTLSDGTMVLEKKEKNKREHKRNDKKDKAKRQKTH